jgi:hypothetical protein
MASITLTDSSSASVNATVFDTSVIGKTPASVIRFLRSDVIGVLDQTLDKVQINSLSIGFDFEPSFPLSGGTTVFTAGGGPTGEIDLYRPAGAGRPSPLFPVDQFGTDIEMGANYYLALSFQLALSAGAISTRGAFYLTPSASAVGSAKLYLPFGPGPGGTYPTLKNALETLLGSFVLPSSVDDLGKLPAGTVFVYETQGAVNFQGQFDVLAAINPTATPGLITSYGPINVSAGPSVTIGGAFGLTGDFQIRLWKKGPSTVQIGYYKQRGSSLAVSLDASVGVDVAVGNFDVVSKIYGLLGDSGRLDPAWLSTHVPSSLAADVATAYATAVQTKLSIAIDAECDTSTNNQVAFSWNFDLAGMGSAAQSAAMRLIKGDLSALMGNAPLPAGITKAGSIFDRMKEKGHTFTFNFLGLFDHATVEDSTLDMFAKVSEDGQLTITDTAHLTRLSADATPFVKSDQLRRVFAEDCVATMGYAASFGSIASTLRVGYNYFNYKSKAQRSDLQLFLATANALGETSASGDWSSIAQSNVSSQYASISAALNFDGAACRNLFLDHNQAARSIADFQEVGRNALLATPGLGLDQRFLDSVRDDAKWHQMLDAGTPQHFYQIIGVDLLNPPPWAILSFTWTSHFVFWAPAMHSTGQALQAVIQYLPQPAGTDLLHDATFLKLRQTFASQLRTAIQKTPLFHDALGLITIFLAAPPSTKTVAITYTGKTKTYA